MYTAASSACAATRLWSISEEMTGVHYTRLPAE
jgi:hypothetical protein